MSRSDAPRPPSRVARLTRIQQDKFLEQFVTMGNVAGCCRATGVGRRTVYHWLKDDAAFRERFADVENDACDALEQEARRRALIGVNKPVFGTLPVQRDADGKVIGGGGTGQVGTMPEYSDTLLIFLLKAKRPEIYRERFEHTGKGGGPIQVKKVVTFGGRYRQAPGAKR